jgi:hypothetical protein
MQGPVIIRHGGPHLLGRGLRKAALGESADEVVATSSESASLAGGTGGEGAAGGGEGTVGGWLRSGRRRGASGVRPMKAPTMLRCLNVATGRKAPLPSLAEAEGERSSERRGTMMTATAGAEEAGVARASRRLICGNPTSTRPGAL